MEMMFSGEALFETIREARRIQPLSEATGWTVPDVITKSMEELGEFSEAVQIRRGIIRNKPEEFQAEFFEAADAIICIVDALTRMYPDKSPSDVYALLSNALERKTAKWVNKVEKDYKEINSL